LSSCSTEVSIWRRTAAMGKQDCTGQWLVGIWIRFGLCCDEVLRLR